MKLQKAISITNIKLVKQDYSTVSVEAVVGRVQERYKQGEGSLASCDRFERYNKCIKQVL